jgi:hypothetical protein
MFKTKELFKITLFNKMIIALNLEWMKGALGFGFVIDGSLTNFAMHLLLGKISFGFHFKWADLDCPTC